MSTHLFIKASIVAGFMIISSTAFAADLTKRQSELNAIQTQINQQQSSLKNTTQQREKLISLLKRDEKSISNVAQLVNQTKLSLKKVNAELQSLEVKSVELDKLNKTQQSTLAKQLSSAYLAGNHDYTKMMLNQQNPATIERMLAYYQFLNNARMKAIGELKQTSIALEKIKQQQITQQGRLNQLILNQQEQSKSLKAEQGQRQQTLDQLQRTLSSKGAELEQLQIEEANLKRVVEQVVKSTNSNPSMLGLANQRSKLKWPTNGSISKRFGSSRSGQIKWKGIVLNAPEGQNINAVAAGKVIYADWLRGFGMVMVVDHGKGYMSLYGHAQTLFKNAGDNVAGGESIGLVGQSGGQSEPSLYFEIRHKGQAVNPAQYCH